MRGIFGAATVVALAAAPALAGVGVGDTAPALDVKESLNITSLTPRDTEGKVLFIEVFRTW